MPLSRSIFGTSHHKDDEERVTLLSSSPVHSHCSAERAPEEHGEGPDNNSTPSEEAIVEPLHQPEPTLSFTSRYRRPSLASGGFRPVLLQGPIVSEEGLGRQELDEMTAEEQGLLKDNGLIPRYYGAIPQSAVYPDSHDCSGKDNGTEGQSLLGHTAYGECTDLCAPPSAVVHGAVDCPIDPAAKWKEAVIAGQIETTWQREVTVLANTALPLVVTLGLQYSLTLASVFSAGNLGKNELAAVSVAGMTANITGYAIFQGLATSLDTLCAQAYGSGNKHQVGLHMQRMMAFLLTITVPIAAIWHFSEQILSFMIPEHELARLAGQYLRILIIGAPGYAIFECGKRFTQAQGIFLASTLVLVFCAPFNAFMNYILVWHPVFGFGFAGAPTAVVITNYLMPLLLFLYVRFINGYQCWGGFSKKALSNWWPMIRLSIPGLIMVEAEFLAFEAVTLLSSYFSTGHVAAQAIVSQTGSIMYQVPFALSIATSTRVGNFLGATLGDAARISSFVALVLAGCIGIMNSTILFTFKRQIPLLFTSDEQVIALVAESMPIVASFQLVDGFVSVACGVLRGQGRQYIAGYINVIAYYVVALPWSVFSAFWLGWELRGLWSGLALALTIVAILEIWVVLKTDWRRVVQEARERVHTV